MDKRFEETVHQRRYTNGKYACENMLNIIGLRDKQIRITM